MNNCTCSIDSQAITKCKKCRDAEHMREHKQAIADAYIENQIRQRVLSKELKELNEKVRAYEMRLRELYPGPAAVYVKHSGSDALLTISPRRQLPEGNFILGRVEVLENGIPLTEVRQDG